jgi:hypothetical protein
MKKLILQTAIYFVVHLNFAFAQQDVVNGNFEFWDTIPGANGLEDPVGWVSNNKSIYNCGSGNYITGISKSTDAYSGNFSLKITPSNNFGGWSDNVAISLTPGNCIINDCFDLPCDRPPVTYRHNKIVGYYKYSPDSAVWDTVHLLSVQPLYDSLGNTWDNLSFTYKWFLPAFNWTYFEIPVQYFYGPTFLGIDFALGIIYYSNNLSSTPTAYFLLDSLAIVPDLTTGATEDSRNSLVKLSPNPAEGILTISSLEPFYYYAIMDLRGSIVMSGKFSNTLDLTYLNKGIYFVRFQGKERTVLEKFVKE